MNDSQTLFSNNSLLRSNTNFIYNNYSTYLKQLQSKQMSSSKNSSTKYPKTNSKSIIAKSTFPSNSFIIQKPENILVSHNIEVRTDYYGNPIKKGKPNYHHISFIDFIDGNKNLVTEHLIQSFKIESSVNGKKVKYIRDMNNGNNKQCCCVIY